MTAAVACACVLEWQHCHGFVVRHTDGSIDCSVECEGDPMVHDEAVDCSELSRACGCG